MEKPKIKTLYGILFAIGFVFVFLNPGEESSFWIPGFIFTKIVAASAFFGMFLIRKFYKTSLSQTNQNQTNL